MNPSTDRVLRLGGRLAINDVVMAADVLEEFRADPESVSGCVAEVATIEGRTPNWAG